MNWNEYHGYSLEKDEKEIPVLFSSGKQERLTVEEYLPYEPSNYVTDPGWTCFSTNETEYFVSEGTGGVYVQPSNDHVGNIANEATQ